MSEYLKKLVAPSDLCLVVCHFEILWRYNGYGHTKFDNVREWCFINHSKDNFMPIKIHKKTIVWKSVVLELLQFEDLLNKGILLRQWRESFIFFRSGKKNSYLKSLKKLFLYFSQINIQIFWKYQKEISDINWSCMIIHQQLEEYCQDCFA